MRNGMRCGDGFGGGVTGTDAMIADHKRIEAATVSADVA